MTKEMSHKACILNTTCTTKHAKSKVKARYRCYTCIYNSRQEKHRVLQQGILEMLSFSPGKNMDIAFNA